MLSTKEAVRHTPPWSQGEGAPVFLLRRGSVIERAQVEAELSGEHQAGRVFPFQLAAAFRDGVNTLLEGDDGRFQILDLLEAELSGQEMAAAEIVVLTEARDEVARYWQPYRQLLAQMERRKEIVPVVALRRFCIGWENVEVAFRRGPDGLLPLDTLAAIDPMEMLSAGAAAYGLLYPDADASGNSQPGSPSDDAQATSSSDSPSTAAAGKSGKSAGRKTRG